jgi:uncharacterized protein
MRKTTILALIFGLVGPFAATASAEPREITETKRYMLGVDTPSRFLFYISCDQAPFIGGACFMVPQGAETVRFEATDATTLKPGVHARYLSQGGQTLHAEERCTPGETPIPVGTHRIQVFVNGAITEGSCGQVAAGTTGEITATFTLGEPEPDPDDGNYHPSQPIYDVVAERKQYIPSGDSTIQVDVFRPSSPGRFPVIVWFDVYYKDDFGAVVDSERDYFVSRGYVFVQGSSPGSNTSGGTYDNAFGPAEQQASYDVVEWAAAQPWSNGLVGMQGLSYSAIIQYFTAAMRPPSLVTIYPASAYSDLYREIVYTGGNLQAGYPILWDVNNRSLAYAPPNHPSDAPVTMTANYATTLAGYRPILPDFLLHPTADDFYSVRSPATRNADIEVPAAIDVGWKDDMVHGGPINFETLGSADKRLVIGPWGHSETHRRPDGRPERLRWFDHYLKGKPSGVDQDPRAKLFVYRGGLEADGAWMTSSAWPVPGTTTGELYLDAAGDLSAAIPASGEVSYNYSPSRHSQSAYDISNSQSVSFESGPLDQDLTSIGYSEVVLYASTTAPDTAFTAVRAYSRRGGSRPRCARSTHQDRNRVAPSTPSMAKQPWGSARHTSTASDCGRSRTPSLRVTGSV